MVAVVEAVLHSSHQRRLRRQVREAEAAGRQRAEQRWKAEEAGVEREAEAVNGTAEAASRTGEAVRLVSPTAVAADSPGLQPASCWSTLR